MSVSLRLSSCSNDYCPSGAALIAVFFFALAENFQVMGRWIERPSLFVFSLIGAVAKLVMAHSVRHRHDRAAVLDGRPRLRRGVRHVGDLVLALHDPVRHHDRGSRRTAFQSRLHVLGRRALRLPAHAALHRDQPHRVQRQGGNSGRNGKGL
jgi:hypothetical protein